VLACRVEIASRAGGRVSEESAGGPSSNRGVASAIRVQAALDEGNLINFELCLAQHANDLAHDGTTLDPSNGDVSGERLPRIEAAETGCCLDHGCSKYIDPVDRCHCRMRSEHVDGRANSGDRCWQLSAIHCFAHVVDVGFAKKAERGMPILWCDEAHSLLIFAGQLSEDFDNVGRWPDGKKQSAHREQFCRRCGVLNPDSAWVQESDWTLLVETGENGPMQSQHSDMKRRLVLFGLMVLIVAMVAGTAFA
jgi:hypothetical protein|tara:strand:- start:570 stop:1322 length:753 start_codon:yes stop_codon:yes gene_type:complete